MQLDEEACASGKDWIARKISEERNSGIFCRD